MYPLNFYQAFIEYQKTMVKHLRLLCVYFIATQLLFINHAFCTKILQPQSFYTTIDDLESILVKAKTWESFLASPKIQEEYLSAVH